MKIENTEMKRENMNSTRGRNSSSSTSINCRKRNISNIKTNSNSICNRVVETASFKSTWGVAFVQ
jgi:hypothetical protein